MGRRPERTQRCAELLEQEAADGMTGLEYYKAFASNVEKSQQQLRELLQQIKAEGGAIAGYGAAAKGATLLNALGGARELIDFVVDRNVHKIGKLIPGCRLPIAPVEELLHRQPSHVVLLAWNFADEIMSQQREYASRGGSFIVPVPNARVVKDG
jgi:hypothetical protein